LQAAIFILWPQEGRGQAGISYECWLASAWRIGHALVLYEE
jgi:hypothetical protein